MATSALEAPAFEPTRFSKKSATWVRAERQDGVRVSGLSGFRETTEDRRRRPQVNPTPSASKVPRESTATSALEAPAFEPTRFSNKSAKWVRAERSKSCPLQRASRSLRDDRGSPKATAGPSPEIMVRAMVVGLPPPSFGGGRLLVQDRAVLAPTGPLTDVDHSLILPRSTGA